MIDYYQVLSVSRDADFSEILQAYRKLSSLYKTAAEGGDTFFNKRLRELEEAFDVLSKPEKREAFDTIFDFRNRIESKFEKNSEIPVITIFESSKKAANPTELVTLRWQISNADFVYIEQIGNVENEGSKTFRLPELIQGEKFQISLTATNRSHNTKSVKKIEIFNKSFIDSESENIILNEKKDHFNSELSSENSSDNIKIKVLTPKKVSILSETGSSDTVQNYNSERKSDILVYAVIVVLIAFVLIMLVVAYKMNPF